MIGEYIGQIASIMRMEIRKTFFARRSMWIYLLAMVPVLLFYANSIYAGRQRERLAQIAATHPISSEDLRSIGPRMSKTQVVEKLGEPYRKFSRQVWNGQRGRGGRGRPGELAPPPPPSQIERATYLYTDGESDLTVNFYGDRVERIFLRSTVNLDDSLLVFASVFQLYFIRLAVVFGCAGIFMNLFRGELLDKSLHFYMLAPLPREVVMLGKYLAGVLATATIFSLSAGLQFWAMLHRFDGLKVVEYMQNGGWSHIGSYMAVAALACAGYGAIFLTAGIMLSNPTIPAAFILIWEGINGFLPSTLKKVSLIYYLQSLCPVAAPPDRNLPALLRTLISVTEPASIAGAVGAILLATAVILVLGGWQARSLEINYSAE